VGALVGLTATAVAERVASGQVNRLPRGTSRTVGQIVRANTLTLFNLIIGTMAALVLVFGDWRDALFVVAIVVNTGIGIIQELRAKATLERLSVVGEAQPRVLRDGTAVDLPMEQIVVDDIVLVGPGDKVVVDGALVEATWLEVDESLLTGEADPVSKRPGDPVLSGSFVVAGSGAYRATRVGTSAYAVELAEQARRFTLVSSDLRAGINRILTAMGFVVVPVGVLLIISQLRNAESFSAAVTGAVAGTVTMVPEGLVLLTSIAFAVGVIRLGQRNVLVQELPAIEGLARADVVCLDKTGTITEPGMAVQEIRVLDASAPVDEALGALGAAEKRPNPSLAAIAAARPAPDGWVAQASVPFSSARKWSGVRYAGRGAWVLGAPEVLLAEDDPILIEVREHAERGLRVLLLARAGGQLSDAEDLGPLHPVALVVISQRIKPDAAATLRYFRDQGVAVKVLSGDSPQTVSAVVRALDVPGVGEGIDARSLPTELDAVGEVMDRETAFGRVSPHQKQAMVRALQSRGHTVAMTGDGVNDVLALKDADIAVAMASGSDASKGVAQIVLVDNRFEQLPVVVAEGRRVVNNIERVAGLFLTKTAYATVISLLSGVVGLPFPFLPRHLTVISALTIGIPGFFLALGPNRRRYRPGFVPRVARFALPAGTVAALASFVTYAVSLTIEDSTRAEAQTLASIVLFVVALWVVILVAQPLNAVRVALVVAMAAGFVLVLVVPVTRQFFAFTLPETIDVVITVGLALVAVGTLQVVLGIIGSRPRLSWSP
jgi:cation-transporting ATPase E